ncbi:DNA repair nucleotidyltransferase [Cellvibrio zantedeschiae]|uniref:DNA repair nucleotidyltransferase n=2 Tax=Cellvibrio zantedeschiae TaxID=1237077 RepID=A0ABQ3B0H5_9GAMM|nr:DNA repair nucleotidyltransferase [Cellvibrio zantedeschiae]
MSINYYPANERLWLALRLSKLPLEALKIDATTEAIVITEMQRVIYANENARSAGVAFGMDATTAQLLSNCEVHLRNRTLEKQALNHLSAQLYQFTPYLETYECEYLPHSGLLLEIFSCLQLFSGLQSLASKIFNCLKDAHYSFEYGLAHTAKGAWLLSFKHYPICGNETQTIFCERLKSLPIHLLQDYPNAIDALKKTGFTTLADIAKQIDAQKISSIKKRLGAEFTEYFCGIFGIEQNFQQNSLFANPLPNYKPLEFFSDYIQFDYPITQNDQLYYPVESLLQNLSDYLQKRQLECQHIEWTLSDIYHNKFLLNVHSDTPESHWQLLYDLTLIQLDSRELPFEVDSLTLICRNTNSMQNRNQLLVFDHSRKSRSVGRSFAITMAKLKARLGDQSIYKLSYRDSLLPEKSHCKISFNDTPNQNLPPIHKKSLRPTWLLDCPLMIEERTQGLYWRGKLNLLAGPERINAQWWEKPVARDYFIAQRHDHVRLWVFFDLHQKAWYLHGIFA